MTRRPLLGVGAVAVAVTVALAVLTLGFGNPGPNGSPGPSSAAGPTGPNGGDPSAVPTARPLPGHELFGYVPYWEMDGTIADHIGKTPLTTLGLYSVTN